MSAISGSFNRGNDTGRFSTPVAINSNVTTYGSVGAVKGVMLGMVTPLPSQISKDTIDGSPNAPCLSIDVPSYWRFRWVVKAGIRSVYILANQNSTGSLNRPSMIVKSNPNIGLANDVVGTAADGAGWIPIGPLSFTSLGSDVVWVELWNNNYVLQTPALFDHIITS
jgi:hypothetical protein